MTTDRRRPYKVRWYSSAIGERVGKAFASRERRDAAAREASQFSDVTVWEVDHRGYTISSRTYNRAITTDDAL